MNKSNKILIFILLINILIISVHSYTLKKYDYGKLFDIASGSQISENFQVSKKQLLNFQLTKDKSDSAAVLFSITSQGAEENFFFYRIFKDEIASEKNSNKTDTNTPLERTLCMSDYFSFSIQMNNRFLGGDLNITIQGISDDSQCYEYHKKDNHITLDSDGNIKLSGETVNLPELSVDRQVINTVTSSTSRILANGIFMFSFITLLFLQLIN